MTDTRDPDARTAAAAQAVPAGPVTLINSFVVEPGRDDAFRALWGRTSEFFRAQPGFVSLRLHRALGPDVRYRWVNVATWASAEQFAAAHAQDGFRSLVARPEWREFPSSPALYAVEVEHAPTP